MDQSGQHAGQILLHGHAVWKTNLLTGASVLQHSSS